MIRLVFALVLANAAFAAPVYWTEWLAQSAGAMTGVITLADSSTVDVAYAGNHYLGTSIVAGGFNYWAFGPDSTWQSSVVDNRPPAFGSVAIGADTSTHTLTFSRSIKDPVIAWMSVNGPGIQFNDPFVVLSSGCGYWGCGTLFDAGGNLMRTVGGAEGHGVIQILGDFTSISFRSENPEGWRGFTVGVLGVADGTIPEPSTWTMFAGAIALGVARWMRRR